MENLPLAAFSSLRIFFSVGRTMRLEYVIKCELFTRKWHVMKRSNLAKWNLIGGIQFKHVKNCLMFMKCNDWVCSDWTLDVVFIVRDGMQIV